MARLVRHRQTKGAATDRPILPPPRHIPTLPGSDQRHRHPESPHLRVQPTNTRESGSSNFNVGSRRLSASFRAVAVTADPSQQADIQQSLTTLPEKLLKIGATVVSHRRYVTFQLAEVAVPRDSLRKILSLIDDL